MSIYSTAIYSVDLRQTVKVEIDWQSKKSIELAEIAKANLENDEYMLVNTFGGLRVSCLLYAKIIGD